jgi:hypothetical protein
MSLSNDICKVGLEAHSQGPRPCGEKQVAEQPGDVVGCKFVKLKAGILAYEGE